tara:strand:- start:254 stop:679 length:426 start_codon:yes stop_codon:yes gene_type:complete
LIAVAKTVLKKIKKAVDFFKRFTILIEVNVIAKYIPKKKSIQIKGFKESYRGNRHRLKKSHAFSMTFNCFEKRGWLKGAVDLDEVNALEQKKSPRPKWKQQVYVDNCKENGFRFFDSKTKKALPKQYHLKLFLEGNKIFVL